MTKKQIEEILNMAESKPIVKSWTLWGVLAASFPYIQQGVDLISEQLPDVISEIIPVVSPGTAKTIQLVGIGVIALRKFFGDNKRVSLPFTSPSR